MGRAVRHPATRRGRMVCLGYGTGLGSNSDRGGSSWSRHGTGSSALQRRVSYELAWEKAMALVKKGRRRCAGRHVAPWSIRLNRCFCERATDRGRARWVCHRRKLKRLPPKCRVGDNSNGHFVGGLRLWEEVSAQPALPRSISNSAI